MKSKTAIIRVYKPGGAEGVLRSFNSTDTSLDFTVLSEQQGEPGASSISIHGISASSFQEFEVMEGNKYSDGQVVEILYGDKDEEEVIFVGKLERAYYAFDSGRQTMKMVIGQRFKEFHGRAATISTDEPVTVGELMHVISSKFNIDVKYESDDILDINAGRVAQSGVIKEILKKSLPRNVNYYMSGESIILYKGTMKGIYELDATVGSELLSYPSADTEKGTAAIRARIIPRIDTGVVLAIPAISKTIFGRVGDQKPVIRKFTINKFTIMFRDGVGEMALECTEQE